MSCVTTQSSPTLELNAREYLGAAGLDVLVFSNGYDGNFSDSKIAGIELIHHGVRTATNGDVRLSPTPEQWDATPELKKRTVLREAGAIEATLAYAAHDFTYTIRAEVQGGGVRLSVTLEKPLPPALEGQAGFHLEFLPSAYFEKTFMMDAALWPVIDERFMFNAVDVLRALPHMDDSFREKVRTRAAKYRDEAATLTGEHPFGVPITRGGWAGNGAVVGFGTNAYDLHRAFPDLFGRDDTLRSLEYLHGCHPDSDISFVSGVGTHSKAVAYGSNRADFSFIAGGVVPGVLILKPDFPENKEDWPFLWGENEYVINLGASYMLLVHLGQALLGEK